MKELKVERELWVCDHLHLSPNEVMKYRNHFVHCSGCGKGGVVNTVHWEVIPELEPVLEYVKGCVAIPVDNLKLIRSFIN